MSDFAVDLSSLQQSASRIQQASAALQNLRVAATLDSICSAVGGGKTDQESYLIAHGGNEMVRSLATSVTMLASLVQTAHDNYRRAETASMVSGTHALKL